MGPSDPTWPTQLFGGGVGAVVGAVLTTLLQGRQARKAAEEAVRRKSEEQVEQRLRALEDFKAEQQGAEQRRRNPR